MTSRLIRVRGVVQGVGFRPFVYKEALRQGLGGFVSNEADGVEILLQGEEEQCERFLHTLRTTPPPLSRIDSIDMSSTELTADLDTFRIIESGKRTADKTTLVSPDIAVCAECLEDMKRVVKYSGYFAVNCTNCGPRYSIIKTLPYDRANSSMVEFTMCDSCAAEYGDPLNRRYHAQPISCNSCGPRLFSSRHSRPDRESIERTARMIKDGKIVAIKGIGGFHIICDAINDAVVRRLREYKNRPHKPFALMCRDAAMVRSVAKVGEVEEKLLTSKEAPIVLMEKASPYPLSSEVAPGIDRIGCMLAYTPLHHLLFEHLDHPVIATSANLGEEPIIRDSDTLLEKLPFIEFLLDHDREIVNAVDDSVVQVVDGGIQMLRLARGYAPKVLHLPFRSQHHILGVGANQKSTIALAVGDNIILSPHIGDLGSMEAFDYFERTVETFKRFYDFEPELIVHDMHPGYETTKWALAQNTELLSLQHHLAHIYACKAEYGLSGEYLGFSFDGTGYGEDGTLWGGEVFVGDERKYHFQPIRLLGGEKAVREPRRVALGLLFGRYTLEEVLTLDLPSVAAFERSEIELLHRSYTKGINAPLSSSVGRLFDAVASLAGVVQSVSYEGQSGLLCESLYDASVSECFGYKISDGVIDIDLLTPIMEYNLNGSTIISMFFNTLCDIVIDIVRREQLPVILTGGVFQNRVLLEMLTERMRDESRKYFFQRTTPPNDASIALGQVYYAIYSMKAKEQNV